MKVTHIKLYTTIIIIIFTNLFFVDVEIFTVPRNQLKSTSKYKITIYNEFFYKLTNQTKKEERKLGTRKGMGY